MTMERDLKRLDLGWWAHNTIYRWCIIELYTYIILLTNVTPINSILKKEQQQKGGERTDSGQHMHNQAALSELCAMFAVRSWPPVRWLRAHHIAQPSFPAPPSKFPCKTLSRQPSSSVVQIHRKHRHEQFTKRAAGVLASALCPHLAPASEMRSATLWKYSRGSQAFKLIMSFAAVFITFLPDSQEGRGGTYYANEWI